MEAVLTSACRKVATPFLSLYGTNVILYNDIRKYYVLNFCNGFHLFINTIYYTRQTPYNQMYS